VKFSRHGSVAGRFVAARFIAARFVATCFAMGLVATSAGCDPQHADWGLGAIASMPTPPDSPARVCGTPWPAEETSSARDACAFAEGASAQETLRLTEDVRTTVPLEHVILLMRENRSFDHLLGHLHERGQPDVEAIPPSYSNVGVDGAPVFPHPATTTCWPYDPAHQSAAFNEALHDGKMDGFVLNAAASTGTDGTFVISNYDETDLPFTYWMARTFAVADRVFAPMASGTFGNRNFLIFGSNAGVVDTGISFPSPRTPMLFPELMSHGYTWGVYSDGSPLSGSLNWGQHEPGVHPLAELFTALDQGTLPNVVFVDGVEGVTDDHPVADLQKGEAWTKEIYDHFVQSPQWGRSVLFFTYDEGGGFADHVPPPLGCRAAPTSSPFTQRGPRIPFVAVSPWIKRNYVSHVPRDYTSITRFIEALFGLPALTARDANADALFDLFDFSCDQIPAVPEAPAPGKGGCTNPL